MLSMVADPTWSGQYGLLRSHGNCGTRKHRMVKLSVDTESIIPGSAQLLRGGSHQG